LADQKATTQGKDQKYYHKQIRKSLNKCYGYLYFKNPEHRAPFPPPRRSFSIALIISYASNVNQRERRSKGQLGTTLTTSHPHSLRREREGEKTPKIFHKLQHHLTRLERPLCRITDRFRFRYGYG
jgi:hypothetical protein